MEMIVEAEAPPKNVVLRMREHIQREASVHAANIGARPTVVAQRALPLCVIYHLDTFVGDATIIVGLDGTMLIDCGFNWQGVRMAQVAKKLGAHADMLISISHFDKDHFYGVAEVVACYPGAKVISRGATTHMAYAAHLGTCKRVAKPNDWNEIDSDLGRRIKAIYPVECLREDCTRGAHPFDDVKNHKQTALGLGVTIEAKKNFSPQPLSVLRDDNSSSVTWLLRAGTVGYYSAGDLETPDEEQVEIADVHVMKCSHHGAKTTASNAFLEKIKPKVAIIQGPSPKHTHPHPQMLARLANHEVSAYATSLRLNYADAAVTRPTVAGSATIAGDIAVVMWDNDTFSVCYVDAGGLQVASYDVDKEEVSLDDVQLTALQDALDMAGLTDLAEDMNRGLATVKARGGTRTVAADGDVANDAVDVDDECCEFCNSTAPARRACDDCLAFTCAACRAHRCPSCALRLPASSDSGGESDNGSDYDGSDYDGSDHDGSDHDGSDHDGSDHDGSDHDGSDHDGSDHDGSDHDGSDHHDGSNRENPAPKRRASRPPGGTPRPTSRQKREG